MDLRDLLADDGFLLCAAKPQQGNRESIALRRLSRVFAEEPESVLHMLVDVALECRKLKLKTAMSAYG